MWFLNAFTDPYLSGVIARGAVVGVLVSVCAALLGVTLVLKRFSMIGDGLSHVGFGAMALAAALGLGREFSLEFSVPVVMLASFLLLQLTAKGRLKGDAAIAVISSSAVAFGVVLYDLAGGMTADACSSLFGSSSIMTVSKKDLLVSVALCLTVLVLFTLLYHRVFAMTFDDTFVRATGSKGQGYSLLLSLLTSVTVVVGMKMMGAIMIAALIIFPALTAMRLCKSFRGVVVTAAALSVGCFVIGFLVGCWFGLQTGPCVVLVNLAVLLPVSLIKRA